MKGIGFFNLQIEIHASKSNLFIVEWASSIVVRALTFCAEDRSLGPT